MGYTTEFSGFFTISPPLDPQTASTLNGISTTRRMRRNIALIARKENISLEDAIFKYGVEAELYYPKESNNFGQEKDESIVDYNTPPFCQPSLWCDWCYDPKESVLKWNGSEKFYFYIEWLDFIIKRILEPKKYQLRGEVKWQGEDESDYGVIRVVDGNTIMVSDCGGSFQKFDPLTRANDNFISPSLFYRTFRNSDEYKKMIEEYTKFFEKVLKKRVHQYKMFEGVKKGFITDVIFE